MTDEFWVKYNENLNHNFTPNKVQQTNDVLYGVCNLCKKSAYLIKVKSQYPKVASIWRHSTGHSQCGELKGHGKDVVFVPSEAHR